MSPEDDVKNEADADQPEDSANDPTDATNIDAESAPHDKDADNAASDAGQSGSETPDSGSADNADNQAELSDDPLGFGTTRMDGAEGDETADPDDPVGQLKAQLEESETRVTTQKDQLLRLTAEMENQRKRAQNDINKAHKFALEKIALDLLPVKDSLEMGLQAATGEDAELTKIVEGSELTLKMLAQVLEKYNIVEVNPVDEKFDPEFHQAMSMQPVEGKEPNTVASVMQKGYTLNDRLIRAALVMVAK